MCLVGGMDAVDERLEVAPHDREGGPELVADIGEQAPPLLLTRTQAAGHRVERARERARFARATLVDARREIAIGHTADRIDDIADRRREPAYRAGREGDQKEHEQKSGAARDGPRWVGGTERARERQEEERGGDDGEDGPGDEEHRHSAHETPAHRPRPAATPSAPRRERLVLRPPRRAPAGGAPPPPSPPSSPAERYPTPHTVSRERGADGSSPSLPPMFFPCASIARSFAPNATPFTAPRDRAR